MKKLFTYLLVAITLIIAGCSESFDDSAIWDKLDDHEKRITTLEELCKQMNTNISSLKTIVEALQNNDYVTGVTPITKDGETIGYTITFTKSQPITIYHGEDGKDGVDGEDGADGKDGTDGYTPIIGVAQDSDGIYYWTLNGEWLLDDAGNKIKAVGIDGKDGQDSADGADGSDGEDGKNGENGADGKDGVDGITPQLKIENDYWYISYDNGSTWSQLGKATGENGKDGQNGTNGINGVDGANGADGKDGDSFFEGIDTSNDDYVVFTLADGTTIKIPTWYAFEQLKEQCEEMNKNITAMQQILEALQNNDYVTSVQQIVEDGKTIGYTIYFSKSGAVTIYHGENGKDGADGIDGVNGADGKDGHSPIVGVRQDSDGIYYWTLDGEWLTDVNGNKIKAVGIDGKDGQDGEDGKDGQDGTNGSDGTDGENGADGKDGVDGITPQLKIENEYWYISYDNGASWTQLGKATGEDGKDGANGSDGDSFFQSVTQDEQYVYFTLADGTVITLPKGLALSITFDEADLVVISPNSTRQIGYAVTSATESVKVEVTSSADIKAKVVADNENGLTGKIHIATGATIDEYSKVIVFVSNGDKVIMRSITFEEAGLVVEENAIKQASAEGGEVVLEFLSNVECEVVIPEEAQSWISVVPATRAMEKQTITLKLEPNEGAARSAELIVESVDGKLSLTYTISQEPNLDYQLALEREALIAIYNALDGDNWTNNDNWCSDKPVSEWYGVTCENGHVNKLWLSYNNLRGMIPSDIATLEYMEELIVDGNEITLTKEIGLLTSLIKLGISDTKSTVLPFSLLSFQYLEFLQMQGIEFDVFPDEVFQLKSLKELGYLYQPISPLIGNLINLESLTIGHTKETSIPVELMKCTKLKHLCINGLCVPNYTLTGEIPTEIGNLKELESLLISNAIFTGGIPQSIANLENLERLYLRRCNIGGDFPCDLLLKLPNLTQVSLEDNNFIGQISEEFASTNLWRNGWRWMCRGNSLDLSPSILYGPIPGEKVYDNNDNVVDFSTIYKENKFTIIFNWAYWCPTSAAIMDELVHIYNKYHEQGVDIIGIYGDGYDESKAMLKSKGAQWRNIEMHGYNNNTYCLESPYVGIIDVVDNNGHIVFNHIENNPYQLDDWLENQLNEDVDYSMDGQVATLQTATVGEGIDIVLMGDAYSDRQIADGTYEADMENLYNNLFTEEPYKSFKDHFNVYYVNVVSATEGYEYGNTALDGYFGDGTLVGGNDNTVFNYALNAISEEKMDEALLIVAMNSDNYAGTCYMYYPESVTGTYGSGPSVAYFPRGGDAETFAQLLHHEACGHGFAKLADEYAYEGMGAVPSDYVSQIQSQQRDWGWWKNVDFTSDPYSIRWKYFINDSRYANEGLGAYEGGLTYWSGVWRPTENSIMRYNTGGFNAPSREAIYYRIHKLAYGDSWQYDYEEFVEWDARNRKSEALAARKAVKPANYKPTHPPVIVNKSWKDAK